MINVIFVINFFLSSISGDYTFQVSYTWHWGICFAATSRITKLVKIQVPAIYLVDINSPEMILQLYSQNFFVLSAHNDFAGYL